LHRFRILLHRAGVEDHHPFIGFDPRLGAQLLQCANASRGFRTDRQALAPHPDLHPLANAGLFDRDGSATAGPHGVEDHEVTHRRRHANAAGDGSCVGEQLGEPLAAIERPHNWGTTIGLHGDHTGPACVVEPAEPFEFLKRLPHTDQSGATAGGVENDVGQGPTELLSQFQAHRLLPFDAVRLL
jgi:hypothetical protein